MTDSMAALHRLRQEFKTRQQDAQGERDGRAIAENRAYWSGVHDAYADAVASVQHALTAPTEAASGEAVVPRGRLRTAAMRVLWYIEEALDLGRPRHQE